MTDRGTSVLGPLTKRFPRLLGNQDLHRKLRDALPQTPAAYCLMTLLMRRVIVKVALCGGGKAYPVQGVWCSRGCRPFAAG